jgi:hypothetical protein
MVWQAPSKKIPPPLKFGSARLGVQQFLHLQETRQRAPVIADPQRDLRGFRRFDHRLALCVVHRHRLFDIDRLAGLGAAHRIVEVAVGQGRDVNRVDIAGIDDGIGVVMPARHLVAFREVLCQGAVAPHHRHKRRILGLVETWPALDLRDIAAADHPPPDGSH